MYAVFDLILVSSVRLRTLVKAATAVWKARCVSQSGFAVDDPYPTVNNDRLQFGLRPVFQSEGACWEAEGEKGVIFREDR